ncbi:ubiquitin-protein ligase E3C isoform X1 [Gadus morhua]|uniref:HECT-type E3 ubiquitin transferase n=1 Tax=Gadus morhua TaxID=8049 RepID=A0A8C5BRA5_GADMO|nr:ubiquitin-protein ligase E3C isoform X1 [Gadus morhua]XP_030204633.1 ubiquitin-protein ligase E3C isoform X1 [Gadus morhua]XP_030204634.1 ubiquitin-protein ligase E3C isoform X1 [Gadus morhua]XP_056440189.1 ubiquitin-protein ligase E3C isoform X1 [Gadus chalcogrammus]XP_056440190.1 ubiquitin-protein ligase E3C isoform X1 [Gadus chalcogrammus]XP_056440191.1 ubiquitin-protein ligase E3C isoform X1 [Gadus chalcogrammus]XP_059901793.1 ubiquitin-protein ligase E3C isoform X1 [Gadus macrocephalu
MFSFEGDFKTRPKVSLGGASRKEEKASLLHRTQEERRKREDERRRLKNAIIIQSYIRGYQDRKQQHSIQRCRFDERVGQIQAGGAQQLDGVSLSLLTRQLIFFYRQGPDAQRLVWLCQSLVKHHGQFVSLLAGPQRQTCLFQIKRILGFCCRVLLNCREESLNVSVPMRMLEVFSSQRTYLPALGDADSVASLLEQILHSMVQKGYYRSLYALVNHRLPSSLEYSGAPSVPLANTLLEHLLRPLLFSYTSCTPGARQSVFGAFTEDFIAAPLTEQIFHFFIPALADRRHGFPFEAFLGALGASVCSSSSSIGPSSSHRQAPWLFYFVLSVGENCLGGLSEEGLLFYLGALKTLLPLLPVSESHSRPEVGSDSEDDDDGILSSHMQDDRRMSVQLITEECVHKLDSKQQTNALLSLVWRDSASEEVFTMMASICHTLMVQHRLMVPKVRLLYSLAFNARFLRHLWYLITSMTTKMITGSMVPLLQVISRGSPMTLEDSNRIIPLFYLFSSLFSHSLISVHDSEFFGHELEEGFSVHPGSSQSSMMPFSLLELVTLSRCLRDACLGIIKLAYPETKTEHREEYMAAFRSVGVKTNMEVQQRILAEQKRWVQLFKVITNLVKMVKARDIRRPFCPVGHWLSREVNIRADRVTQLYVPSARHVWRTRRMGRIGPLQSTLDVGMEPPQLSVSEERHLAILTELPFVVPFEERVKIFQRLIYADKRDVQGDGPFPDGINVTIRRNYIYEDAYDKLSPENEPDLKKRVRVHLLNAHGLDEAGIDGGGIFREFLNELLRSGFNPNQGFFKTTNEGLLYPSPTAQMLVGDSFARHYYFLGRILGKALYENMLVELPFASFFLSKLLGTSAEVDIHHLASLDPEMYRNLLFLKSYEGDVEELGLNFTIVNNDLGEAQVVELKLGGKDIPVTTANRIAYIHLVADYRLNKQIRAHCLAFRQGIANVVNLEWLRMFDQQEIQVLISGAHVPICLDDLKKFTNYSGGYTATHPVIETFWEVVEGFTDEEKRKLLLFVTSCSRPPLFGFKELYPAFCIHNGGNDLERLPTASTCMNLLKLPEFCDANLMRNKLLYAIESSAGFELS